MHGNFPGDRSMIWLDTEPLIATLSELWGSPLAPYQAYQPVVFSALMHPEGARLTVDQRLPHVDPGVTAMIYLNPDAGCAGGTGLYRHRLTGLERIPPGPTPAIREPAARCGFQDAIVFNPLFAAPEGEYVNDGNDFWELLYLVEMRHNRLVIFDGRTPRSQHIQAGQYSQRIRLNQILYLKARDPARA